MGEVEVATLEGFTAGLAAAEARLWRMAVGRIIRTLRTTGIPDHLITGSTTIPARTMTTATPLMCNRHRVM